MTVNNLHRATWPPYHIVPGYTIENLISTGITIHNIKATYSDNYTHMHSVHNKQKDRSFCSMELDFGTDGSARVGRTKPFNDKGLYGDDITSISVASYDFEKNRQPEPVTFNKDKQWAGNRV